MSTPDFQIAMAKLIASPETCEKTLVDENNFFSEFNLSAKEKKRIHSILRQKGISACCSLYRMNRITPIYMQLSNTSFLLGDDFVPLMEEFWLHYAETSLQFKEEVLEFGKFLMQKIETGTINISYLKEVLQLEIAINELSYSAEGEFRILKFDFDIFQILYFLSTGTLKKLSVNKSELIYKIYLQDQKLKMDIF